MNIRQAVEDTMQLAHERVNAAAHSCVKELSYDHLCEMHEAIDLNRSMSDTKLCRWLGWMQAAIVSWGTATLDDMKNINKRNAS